MAQADFYERYGPTFAQVYAQIREAVIQREATKTASGQRKDFHFLAASLARFLPDIPPQTYESIYLNILVNHQLSAHSFQYTDYGALAYMDFGGYRAFLDAPERRPTIFCTFHLGGYRAVLAKLLHAGYPLALVIDNRTYRQQKDFLEGVAAAIARETGQPAVLDILDAETPDIGRRMALAIGRGRSILIFLDGNTGVGGIYNRTGRQLKVRFLAGEIYSRTGIAMLSHALRVPIIPIVSYYRENRGIRVPQYWCGDPILPQDRQLPQDDYVRVVTGELYDLLASVVKQYPDQWESWFYFHKFLDLDALRREEERWLAEPRLAPNPEIEVVFNQSVYGLFRLEDSGYLFHKSFYAAYPLGNDQYVALDSALVDQPRPLEEYRRQWGDAWVDFLLHRRILTESQARESLP